MRVTAIMLLRPTLLAYPQATATLWGFHVRGCPPELRQTCRCAIGKQPDYQDGKLLDEAERLVALIRQRMRPSVRSPP